MYNQPQHSYKNQKINTDLILLPIYRIYSDFAWLSSLPLQAKEVLDNALHSIVVSCQSPLIDRGQFLSLCLL